MARIQIIDRADMNAEQARVYDAAKQSSGIVGGPYYAYIRLPKLFEACQNLRGCLAEGPFIPPRAAGREPHGRKALERPISVVRASPPLALGRHRSSSHRCDKHPQASELGRSARADLLCRVGRTARKEGPQR